jgi:rubrerythrin|tara:strand:+ start:38154 stop:38642 length:489 start_codon:yes stop_codon:yes gene_type:complete
MPVSNDFSGLDLMDALDLAILIETEAWKRYTFFAEQIGHREPWDAAAVFLSMARSEEEHGRQLGERRQELFGDATRRVSKPAMSDVEAPDYGSPHWNMSPLKALQVALESEERAFQFYGEALKQVTDPVVRELFAELRDEEVEHVRVIKEAIGKAAGRKGSE